MTGASTPEGRSIIHTNVFPDGGDAIRGALDRAGLIYTYILHVLDSSAHMDVQKVITNVQWPLVCAH